MTCTLTYKILIPLFNAGCSLMFKNQIFRMKWEECYLTTFYLLPWCHPPVFALSMKQTQAFSLAFTVLPHLHYEVKKKRKSTKIVQTVVTPQPCRILLFCQAPPSFLAGDFIFQDASLSNVAARALAIRSLFQGGSKIKKASQLFTIL